MEMTFFQIVERLLTVPHNALHMSVALKLLASPVVALMNVTDLNLPVDLDLPVELDHDHHGHPH